MKTEITWKDAERVSTTQEAWGDRTKYRVPPEKMPPDGEVYLCYRGRYGADLKHWVKRQPDGSGEFEDFYSIGD